MTLFFFQVIFNEYSLKPFMTEDQYTLLRSFGTEETSYNPSECRGILSDWLAVALLPSKGQSAEDVEEMSVDPSQVGHLPQDTKARLYR
jgi:hypothetical protein